MEAAGVEPASESIQQQVSTCISPSLISSPGARRGKAPRNQPRRSFAPRPQDETGSLSRPFDAPEAPRERTPGTACLSIRPRLLKVLQLRFFHRLTRWVGPRHATCASLLPSKPVRPHTPFSFYYRAGWRGCQPEGVKPSGASLLRGGQTYLFHFSDKLYEYERSPT